MYMMTSSNRNFSALLAFSEGNPPVIGGFPHQGQWRGALMFSLICPWTNGWANSRNDGDLRRHRPHYDVIVMYADWDPLHLNILVLYILHHNLAPRSMQELVM